MITGVLAIQPHLAPGSIGDSLGLFSRPCGTRLLCGMNPAFVPGYFQSPCALKARTAQYVYNSCIPLVPRTSNLRA